MSTCKNTIIFYPRFIDLDGCLMELTCLLGAGVDVSGTAPFVTLAEA
jgi:hypothetical protein